MHTQEKASLVVKNAAFFDHNKEPILNNIQPVPIKIYFKWAGFWGFGVLGFWGELGGDDAFGVFW